MTNSKDNASGGQGTLLKKGSPDPPQTFWLGGQGFDFANVIVTFGYVLMGFMVSSMVSLLSEVS